MIIIIIRSNKFYKSELFPFWKQLGEMMNNNDIFNLIRNAVDMHENRDSLERFKSLCRQFIKELAADRRKG